MPPNLKVDLTEVARLTRDGRLEDAFAVLKRVGSTLPVGESSPSLPRSTGLGAARLVPGAIAAPLRSALQVLGLKTGATSEAGAARNVPDRAEAPTPRARFAEHVYGDAQGSRSYKLYEPTERGTNPMPLVVMLHGCQQSPDDFAAGTRMNALAEEQGFLVAYPGQPSSANPSRCWNWFNAGDQRRGKGEPALIAGLTRQIIQGANVDPRRVYVAGLSAGGAEAAILGATYPDLYAAVCVHSGLACGAAKDMSSAFTAMRQGGAFVPPGADRLVPTIVFHGDSDHTVHPVNGVQVIAQARATQSLHATVSEGRSAGGIGFTRTVQADRDGHPVLEHWVLHGAGHAWSGGSATGSYTDPRGPDASREMLRFFALQTAPVVCEAAA